MVSDKYQVRSTGPNHNLTRQPVKGRKMGGGIRLGEMERDSMLAHGAAYMLYDRLMNCSDSHKVCCDRLLEQCRVWGLRTDDFNACALRLKPLGSCVCQVRQYFVAHSSCQCAGR
jgi:DNA-directed RNA polymerase beta subunit